MRKSIGWGAALSGAVLLLVLPAAARSIRDATGRSVELPETIGRILPAGQPAAILVYRLAPEKLLGWPRKPSAAGLAFLLPAARALPEIGVLLRNGKVNDGAIAEQKPDVIVDHGSLAPDYVAAAERVQAETGIPYLLFDGALERSPLLLRQLGEALGVAPRGEALGAEAERILALVRAQQPSRGNSAAIPFYYSRSDDGLSTATSAAHATDVLRLFDLFENVADGNADPLPRLTREQVIALKPQMVFAPNADYIKAFAAPEWAELPAVAKHQL